MTGLTTLRGELSCNWKRFFSESLRCLRTGKVPKDHQVNSWVGVTYQSGVGKNSILGVKRKRGSIMQLGVGFRPWMSIACRSDGVGYFRKVDMEHWGIHLAINLNKTRKLPRDGFCSLFLEWKLF